VNFVGPNDEFVVSGSDDGYFFMWRRESGALHGIYEGDGSVVNVIEAHPTLPLLAVSGIDHEPKVSPPFPTFSLPKTYVLFSCSALAKERMSGRGLTGQKISSITTWTASSFPRYSHSSRTLGLSSISMHRLIGPFSMHPPVKRVEMSLCCITTVVSYLPMHVVSGHASG
jgi:hypothetical protein